MSAPGGKGSARRPTDEAAYSAGYDATFGTEAALMDRVCPGSFWERSFPDRKADQAWVDSQRAENLSRVSTMCRQLNNSGRMYSLQAHDDTQDYSP